MGTLHDAAECRSLAAQCLEIAKRLPVYAVDRARLIEMARRWRQRAREAEREHAKKADTEAA